VRTLVIDTATKACSVALFDGDTLVAASHEIIGRGHAERLLPVIAALPDRGRADQIAVDVGPGSFTGIRVGVAAAAALGLAWNVPVRGFGCLNLVAAMAQASTDIAKSVDVVMTGGHGEYFQQAFDVHGQALADPVSVSPGDLPDRLRSGFVAGDIEAVPTNVEHLFILPDARFWRLLSGAASLPAKPVYGRAPDAKRPEARKT
jgi:tRNA threonylcarbamoyladenosine biosynthesis protein TsaB